MQSQLIKDTPNDDLGEFTHSNLKVLADDIRELRVRLMFSVDDAGADPFAERYYLLALASLEAAHHHLELAALHQARGVAGR